MKIELGSGNRPREGYIHCDLRVLEATDVVCRAENLPFGSNSVECIVASHLIEHFPHSRTMAVLLEWRRVLCPGGEILIITPNLGYVAHGYASGAINYREARNRLFGDQDYAYNFHYTVFDSPAMSLVLAEAGFREIRDVTTDYERRKVPMSLYFKAEK